MAIYTIKREEETTDLFNIRLFIEVGNMYIITEGQYGGEELVEFDKTIDNKMDGVVIKTPDDSSSSHGNSNRVKITFNKQTQISVILPPNKNTKAEYKFTGKGADKEQQQLDKVNKKTRKITIDFINYALDELNDVCNQSREHPDNIDLTELDKKYEYFIKNYKEIRRTL